MDSRAKSRTRIKDWTAIIYIKNRNSKTGTWNWSTVDSHAVPRQCINTCKRERERGLAIVISQGVVKEDWQGEII